MGRPVKWSRDLHPIRERAKKSRTETWSRKDLQILFDVGRATAQSLMKAVGQVQAVGASHFVERTALLQFLDLMIVADSVEDAFKQRLMSAGPVPKNNTLRTTLAQDLRRAMLTDLPANIVLSPGRIELKANSAMAMVEALITLALVMQNDLERWERAISPPRPAHSEQDEDLKRLISHMRKDADVSTDEALLWRQSSPSHDFF